MQPSDLRKIQIPVYWLGIHGGEIVSPKLRFWSTFVPTRRHFWPQNTICLLSMAVLAVEAHIAQLPYTQLSL